jgi:ribosomal protein S6
VTRVKLIVNPTGFSEKLKERVAEVKLRAQRWERRALRLSMQSQNAAMHLQIQNTVAQSRIDDNVQKILNRTEEIEDRLSRSKILESLDSFLHVIVSTCTHTLFRLQHSKD